MQAAAFVMARAAGCMARVEGMKVANNARTAISPVYTEEDFLDLERQY